MEFTAVHLAGTSGEKFANIPISHLPEKFERGGVHKTSQVILKGSAVYFLSLYIVDGAGSLPKAMTHPFTHPLMVSYLAVEFHMPVMP